MRACLELTSEHGALYLDADEVRAVEQRRRGAAVYVSGIAEPFEVVQTAQEIVWRLAAIPEKGSDGRSGDDQG